MSLVPVVRAAYGGHVYAQAAWAASLTVGKGFHLSNVTGHFLLPALVTTPYIYHVQKLRDGRSHCTRIITVTQGAGTGVMFSSTCVFKLPEKGPVDVQTNIDLYDKYRAVLLPTSRPHHFPEPASVDAPWYRARWSATGHNEAFPGLDMRKVEMAAYNDLRHPLDRRQLMVYRSTGTLPAAKSPSSRHTASAGNMHLCAHLYASDRNGLFSLADHFGLGDLYSGIGTLTHQVIFHSSIDAFDFGEDKGGGAGS